MADSGVRSTGSTIVVRFDGADWCVVVCVYAMLGNYMEGIRVI